MIEKEKIQEFIKTFNNQLEESKYRGARIIYAGQKALNFESDGVFDLRVSSQHSHGLIKEFCRAATQLFDRGQIKCSKIRFDSS